jgi:hypothetical protein
MPCWYVGRSASSSRVSSRSVTTKRRPLPSVVNVRSSCSSRRRRRCCREIARPSRHRCGLHGIPRDRGLSKMRAGVNPC